MTSLIAYLEEWQHFNGILKEIILVILQNNAAGYLKLKFYKTSKHKILITMYRVNLHKW